VRAAGRQGGSGGGINGESSVADALRRGLAAKLLDRLPLVFQGEATTLQVVVEQPVVHNQAKQSTDIASRKITSRMVMRNMGLKREW